MTSERIFEKPAQSSFFLFGPRATGKSTWLKNQVNPDLTVDLLRAREYQRFAANPSLLREMIEGKPSIKIVVVDEIQKLPILLDEIHSLIFDYGKKIQFILTGSSSRKLKKTQVNLLAGRALIRNFHAYSCLEIKKKFTLKQALSFGMLPEVWNLETEDEKKDYLSAYVQTYLQEEIQKEAAVRNLPAYISFLEHFALRNSQIMNIQNISRETGIARTTLNGYMSILEDTLLGFRLAPLHLKAKVKEVATSKFYFFDTGVARALSQSLDDENEITVGAQMETLVLHELKTYSDYHQKRWQIHYWGTPSENEVDFIISRGRNRIGIEVKSSTQWHKEFNVGLSTLLGAGKIEKAYGIYAGKEILKKDGVFIYPYVDFVEMMHKTGLEI